MTRRAILVADFPAPRIGDRYRCPLWHSLTMNEVRGFDREMSPIKNRWNGPLSWGIRSLDKSSVVPRALNATLRCSYILQWRPDGSEEELGFWPTRAAAGCIPFLLVLDKYEYRTIRCCSYSYLARDLPSAWDADLLVIGDSEEGFWFREQDHLNRFDFFASTVWHSISCGCPE